MWPSEFVCLLDLKNLQWVQSKGPHSQWGAGHVLIVEPQDVRPCLPQAFICVPFPLGPADDDLVRCASWKWRLSSPPYPIPGIQGAFSPGVQTSALGLSL